MIRRVILICVLALVFVGGVTLHATRMLLKSELRVGWEDDKGSQTWDYDRRYAELYVSSDWIELRVDHARPNFTDFAFLADIGAPPTPHEANRGWFLRRGPQFGLVQFTSSGGWWEPRWYVDWHGFRVHAAVLAHLLTGAPILVVAVIVGRHRYKKRRERALAASLCPHCGYDLRATPERCPECGKSPIDA